MSGPGTLWELPGGHRALEVSGSTGQILRVCVIRSNWPFPEAPREVVRSLCTQLPSRYYQRAPEALL